MKALSVLGLLFLMTGCYGMCFERQSRRILQQGSTIMRTKIMRNSTLRGTYECTCRSGGRLVCSAVDIPCWDVTRTTWAPKGSRFHAQLRDRVMECTCMGQRARFQDCRPLSLAEQSDVEENTIGCEDSYRDKIVSSGDWYYRKDFGQILNCTCDHGRPERGSCKLAPDASIDPCKRNDCHYSATCSPRDRSYTCECNSGYEGNGRTCNDIDECSASPSKCNSDADCRNTVGSYLCTCKQGFTGDGSFCAEAVTEDPCNEGIWFCSREAQCVPDGRDYSCRCHTGYTGDGHSCDDIDECADGSANCNENAYCNNTLGSFRCTCQTGYEGNGYYCRAMCRDESFGNYVRTGQVYTKVSDGVQMTCTCYNGEAVENSCISSREEVVPVEAPCSDAVTGGEVNSGDYYIALFGRTHLRCLCNDGRPHRGSCRIHRQTTTTTTTATTTTATPRTTRRTSQNRKCRDREGNYYKPGETYVYRTRSAAFTCTCTSYQGTSKCRRKYD